MAEAETGLTIQYRPTIKAYLTTTTSSSKYSEQSGKTADNKIVVLKQLSDNGQGGFVGEQFGTVNYVGKELLVKLVEFDKTTESYKSDHEDAKEFQKTLEDDSLGSSNSNTSRGGEYSTASVSEQVLAGVSISYRVGAGAPTHSTTNYTPPAIVLDLCPLTTDQIVVNSVMFRWMGTTYRDLDGVIYRDWTDISPGIASGVMNYAAGTAGMYDWVVGGTGPTDFQLLSLWTRKGEWSTASLFFNTDAYPLRAGAGGFTLSVLDTTATPLTANVDTQGNITGLHMRGRVEFSRGGVALQFGDFVPDVDITAAQRAEWWYSSLDVGAVEPGKIWRPWPVLPDTLRYSAISFIYLPVDVSLMGIDPAALPSDGRVPFARPGDLCVVGVTHGGPEFVPTVGMVYTVGHERLSVVQVIGTDGAEVFLGYTADLDAGTVTFNDVTGYPAKVKVVARTEVYNQVAEVRIDGKVKLKLPVGYEFPAGAVFSTALRQDDRFARVSRTYSQKTWDGVKWFDGVDPAVGEATAKYTGTIEVTNLGCITERWALKMRGTGTKFDLVGQRMGQIAEGDLNVDFAPLNPITGTPYMRIPATGWNQGWGPNNTLFVDTVGAESQIAAIRCTQPGSPAGIDDSCWFEQRGDEGREPESSFA